MKLIITCLIIISTSISNAQSFNQEIIINDQQHLSGKFTVDKLQSEPYANWYEKNHGEYIPDQNFIDSLNRSLSKYTLKVFMGTWCGDSKREVPRLYKVLEESNFPLNRLTAVALELRQPYYKRSPSGEEEGYSIHRVPTIIVLEEGKEVGRIVERPKESIEADLWHIIQGDYEENYPIVSKVSDAFDAMGWEAFGAQRAQMAAQLKDLAKHYMELHTYSRVLYSAGKLNEALEVLKLNQLLFPEEPNIYFNLGFYYWENDQKELAQKYFDQAIAKNPENEEMRGKIELVKEKQKP